MCRGWAPKKKRGKGFLDLGGPHGVLLGCTLTPAPPPPSQTQQSKFVNWQVDGEYRGSDFTAAVTLGNPDVLVGSGKRHRAWRMARIPVPASPTNPFLVLPRPFLPSKKWPETGVTSEHQTAQLRFGWNPAKTQAGAQNHCVVCLFH